MREAKKNHCPSMSNEDRIRTLRTGNFGIRAFEFRSEMRGSEKFGGDGPVTIKLEKSKEREREITQLKDDTW